jgi:hypothetical protein
MQFWLTMLKMHMPLDIQMPVMTRHTLTGLPRKKRTGPILKVSHADYAGRPRTITKLIGTMGAILVKPLLIL